MRKETITKASRNILLFLCLILTGCFAKEATKTPTVEKTQAPFTAALEKPRNTERPPMSRVTETAMPNITSTSIVNLLPTYSLEDTRARVQSLIQDNGECQFPCVWGIDPISTRPESANELVTRFGNNEIPKEFFVEARKHENSAGITSVIWNNNLRTFIDFSLYENQEEIENIVFYVEFTEELKGGTSIKPVFGNPYFSELLHHYLPGQILTGYGAPSQIFIKPYEDEPTLMDYQPLFSLVMIYEDIGFLVEYLFPRETDGKNYVGCPSKTATLSLITWDPATKPTLFQMVFRNSGRGINDLDYHQFKSLEEASLMKISEFTEIFQKADTGNCLSTPRDLWRIP